MTFLAQPLSVYPIWNLDGNPNDQILQGNDSDPRDNGNDHLAGTPLEWAFDFPTPVGTDVHAVADGVVVYVNMDAMAGHANRLGYGNVITIQSVNSAGQTYYTTYAHLSGASVAAGDSVTAGEVIGSSGDSGAPGAPHLHIQFGTIADSEVLDGAKAGGTNYGIVADGENDIAAPAYFSVPNSPLTMRWDPADDPSGLNAKDVIYFGTAGNDFFIGNNNGDIVHGGGGNDTLIGGQGNDTLDALQPDGSMGSGNDTFQGNGGNDLIIGGLGINTAVYSGAPNNYIWSKHSDGSWTITDERPNSPDGTDTLRNIQILQFASGAKFSLSSSNGPTLVNDNPLSVSVGSTTVITSANLSVSESGYADDQLVYTVDTPPSQGQLLVGGTPAASFTQADVDKGLVTYQEFASGASSDYFTFSVSDASGGKTADVPFQIDIGSRQTLSMSYSTINDPSAQDFFTSAQGSNNVGQIIGDYNPGGNIVHGFLYSTGQFTTIDDPLASTDIGGTWLNGINDLGEMVGSYEDSTYAYHGFLYVDGTFETIDAPYGPSDESNSGTWISGINNHGQMIGYFSTPGANQSFLYDGSVFTAITDPLGIYTRVAAINDNGEVVGTYNTSPTTSHGFVYNDGNFITIDDPLGDNTVLTSINDLGQIIGSSSNGNFLYSNGAFTYLNNSEGLPENSNVTGINDAGAITGSYVDTLGQTNGFTAGLQGQMTIAGSSQLGGGILAPASIVVSGGTLSGFGTIASTVDNEGTVLADGGALELTKSAAGTGLFQVGLNSSLILDNFFAGTVQFTNSDVETLVISDLKDFVGKIDFSQALSVVDFRKATITNAVISSDVLSLTTSDKQKYQIETIGAPDGTYVPQPDDSGGTEFIICFFPGTRIATPDGYETVESLKRGDLVETLEGGIKPIRWVGRQTVSTIIGDPLRVFPIRIKSGAIADNVPSRDLLLSPDHAVLIGQTLFQAGALVNGTSIVRETNAPRTFTYYHIELDDHSLILAENVPAETFVDNVERLAFDNWAEHEALYPHGKPILEMPYPRAKAYRQVPLAIRAKLAERACQLAGAAAA